MPEGEIDLGSLVPLLAALIPAAGGAVAGFAQRQAGRPRPYRKLGHLVDMLAKAPEGPGRLALEKLVIAAAGALEESVVSVKKVNPTNVALTVIVTAFSGLGMYWLAQWIIAAEGSAWIVVAWITSALVGFFLTIVVAAAIGTVYNPTVTRAERAALKAQGAGKSEQKTSTTR